MSSNRTVVIVGAGVIGLCTAYYLARRGFRVTVVDRFGPQAEGCSFGNAGMVVPSHFTPLAAPGMVALGLKWMWNPESPFYIQPRLSADLLDWGLKFWRAANRRHVEQAAPLLRDLHLASRAAYEEFAGLPGNDFGFATKGLLMLCKTQHALDEEAATAAKANQLGIPAKVLDPRQTAELDPGARMDIAGSVYFPRDCHLSPERFMARLRQWLEPGGAEFAWESAVSGWRTRGLKIDALQTTRGEITADEFILCGGSWSPAIVQGLGLRLPMQAGKGYSLTLTAPRQLPQICSILTEARVAVTPMGQALRFGGTMEMAGMNEDINPARVQGIIKAVPRYYPDFKPEDFHDLPVWHGLRPCSPDGLPYLGRTRRFENLTIATGHAMMGLSLGPITGKLMAELLSGERTSIDISLLNPDRYDG